jgi:glycosyltransferase involved in cell wall biosynthesis
MVILIPAYEPDGKLIDLLRRLRHHDVVVVDDGSGARYAPVFAEASRSGATIVTLKLNRGKGFALKTGFAHIRRHFPGHDVVCADSDGQHRPDDIDAVADRLASTEAAMVLGARRFTGNVPARSKVGNAISRRLFKLTTGLALIDTQTGLRGYPARMLDWLGEVGGDRFEYELRLLLRAAREGLRVEEIPIATVYLEHNASSHFRPMRDSIRIYRPLFAFAASSLLGFGVDTVALFLFAALTGNVVLSAVGARLISAVVNYTVNSTWVFAARGALRYATLASSLLVANVLVLQALTDLTGSLVFAKVGTELMLFAASYLVQKHVVFRRSRHPEEARGDNTVLVGGNDELGPVPGIEFGKEPANVGLDGCHAQVQVRREFGVAQAGSDKE